MKIGVFDSGLGGLIVLKSIVKKLPKYDYVYLGDTLHMPYGNRSQAEIFKFTKRAVEFLFKQDCKLVVIACNTSSSRALRRIQREFLPKKYKDRKVLGVVIPTAEVAASNKAIRKLGVIGTKATVNSRSYIKEVNKRNKRVKVMQSSAPKLATAIETADKATIKKLAQVYLKPLLKKNPDAIILGCTHYSVINATIKSIVGKGVKIIDQTESVPTKTVSYLKRHKEISKLLSKKGQKQLFVTKLTNKNNHLAKRWFGKNAKLNLVRI